MNQGLLAEVQWDGFWSSLSRRLGRPSRQGFSWAGDVQGRRVSCTPSTHYVLGRINNSPHRSERYDWYIVVRLATDNLYTHSSKIVGIYRIHTIKESILVQSDLAKIQSHFLCVMFQEKIHPCGMAPSFCTQWPILGLGRSDPHWCSIHIVRV